MAGQFIFPLAASPVDLRYAGRGTITGPTELQTGAATYTAMPNALVRIHERNSGHVVAVVRSDAAGNYTVQSVSPDYSYYAVAFDAAEQYDCAATRSLQVVSS